MKAKFHPVSPQTQGARACVLYLHYSLSAIFPFI